MEQELQDRSRPSTVCAICIRSDAYIDGIRQHRFLSILSRLPSVFPLSLPRKSHPPTRETHPTIRVQRFAVVVSLDPANPSPVPSPLTRATTTMYYHYYYLTNTKTKKNRISPRKTRPSFRLIIDVSISKNFFLISLEDLHEWVYFYIRYTKFFHSQRKDRVFRSFFQFRSRNSAKINYDFNFNHHISKYASKNYNWQ